LYTKQLPWLKNKQLKYGKTAICYCNFVTVAMLADVFSWSSMIEVRQFFHDVFWGLSLASRMSLKLGWCFLMCSCSLSLDTNSTPQFGQTKTASIEWATSMCFREDPVVTIALQIWHLNPLGRACPLSLLFMLMDSGYTLQSEISKFW